MHLIKQIGCVVDNSSIIIIGVKCQVCDSKKTFNGSGSKVHLSSRPWVRVHMTVDLHNSGARIDDEVTRPKYWNIQYMGVTRSQRSRHFCCVAYGVMSRKVETDRSNSSWNVRWTRSCSVTVGKKIYLRWVCRKCCVDEPQAGTRRARGFGLRGCQRRGRRRGRPGGERGAERLLSPPGKGVGCVSSEPGGGRDEGPGWVGRPPETTVRGALGRRGDGAGGAPSTPLAGWR